MKSSHPKPIDSVLSSVLEDLGLGQRIKQMKVLDAWPAVVGERIAKVATAERIERGRLTVHVSHATWRNELVFLKKDIIARLNRMMGEEAVKDIMFR